MRFQNDGKSHGKDGKLLVKFVQFFLLQEAAACITRSKVEGDEKK